MALPRQTDTHESYTDHHQDGLGDAGVGRIKRGVEVLDDNLTAESDQREDSR
jgi:hypothetical protein